MVVWEVGVSNAESSRTEAICATKEIAIREVFKLRNSLVKEHLEMKKSDEESEKEFIEEKAKQGVHFGFSSGMDNMWDRMIKGLEGDDYNKWDSYPHDTPWIRKTKVMDK